MRVSLVPWELIWLASLIVFGLSLLGVVIGWLRHRKGGWPTSPLLYLSLLLVIAIPAGLKLTGYRFDLDTKHDEITRPEHALPDLITRQYGPTTIQAMYDAAVRAIQQSKTYGQPWRITYAGVDAYEAARIDVLVPVFFFTDTMSISIVTNRGVPGSKDVDIFSGSETGLGDWGENGRHIVQFYNALEAELANLPDEPPTRQR